jgi:hypothetical protein
MGTLALADVAGTADVCLCWRYPQTLDPVHSQCLSQLVCEGAFEGVLAVTRSSRRRIRYVCSVNLSQLGLLLTSVQSVPGRFQLDRGR